MKTSRNTGFTLIEIALALGVAAFALVAILGMIPVALDNSRESRLQTRAAFISRGIFDDLTAGTAGKAIVKTANQGVSADFTLVDLTSTTLDRTFVFSYNTDGIMLNGAGNFDTGSGMSPNALFTAQLKLQNVVTKGVRAEVRVETPASTPHSNRKSYLFVTFIKV